MFNETDSTNNEAYNTGKKRKKKSRGKKIDKQDKVQTDKKGPVRKKRSYPKKSVIKM